MSDEQRIAALREGIRWAGWITGRIRRLLGLATPLLVAAVAFCYFFWMPHSHAPDPNTTRLNAGNLLLSAILGGWAGLYALPVCLPIGLALAVLFRGLARRRMGRTLETVSPEDRASVLLPLQCSEIVDDGDTRLIVEGLIREFRLATEVAPATAPDARGDEASPAESAP